MEPEDLPRILVAFVEPAIARLESGKRVPRKTLAAINFAARTLLKNGGLALGHADLVARIVTLTAPSAAAGGLLQTDLAHFAVVLRQAIVSARTDSPDSEDLQSLSAGHATNAGVGPQGSMKGESDASDAPKAALSERPKDSEDLSGRWPGLLGVIKLGIEAVPATKYALGAAGIGASTALTLAIFSGNAFYAVVAVFVGLTFSVLVLVFANLAVAKPETFQLPAKLLVWVVIVVFSAAFVLLFTSTFFDSPLRIRSWIGSLQVYFDVSKNLPGTDFPLTFEVLFVNNFQDAEEWSGFRIKHQTGEARYTVNFPTSKGAFESSLHFEYVEEFNQISGGALEPQRIEVGRPPPPNNGGVAGYWTRHLAKGNRVDSFTWIVPTPSTDRTYKVWWSW